MSMSPTPAIGSGAGSAFSGVPLVHTCRWPAQKLSPKGGYLKLASCDGLGGHIQYPKFSGNQGTVSARVVASTQGSGVGKIPIKVAGTVAYFAFTYTSTSKSDTNIYFYGTITGPTDGSKILGPFQKTKTYYGHFEILNSNGWGQITISGTTKGQTVLGIPFPGTTVEAGKKTYLLLSTMQ